MFSNPWDFVAYLHGWWLRGGPAHVAEWSAHSAAICSREWRAHGRGSRLSPGASAYQRIISNNSYAHDEQGVNPGQVRGFDSVLYKLWPLLMHQSSRCQLRWRESRSRQMWLSPMARRRISVGQGWHWISVSPGLATVCHAKMGRA